MKRIPLRSRSCFLSTIFCLAFCSHVHADFQLFDDFQDETPGPISTQDNWYASSSNIQVTSDPDAAGNQTLYVPSDSAILRKSLLTENLAILNNQVRMMFMRMRVGNKQTFSMGISPYSSPSEYSDFAPEIGMANSTPNLDLRAWDENDGNYEPLTQIDNDKWYNMWVLVNAQTDDYQIWLNDTPGAHATAADQLDAPDGDTTFNFRSGSTRDLITFYIKSSGGSSSANFGPIYLDDIYLEVANSFNLSNPISTPNACSIRASQGDFNCDAIVNLLDLDILGQNWQQTGLDPLSSYTLGDANSDTSVGLLDLDILGDHWLQQTSIPEPSALYLLTLIAIPALKRLHNCSM